MELPRNGAEDLTALCDAVAQVQPEAWLADGVFLASTHWHS